MTLLSPILLVALPIALAPLVALWGRRSRPLAPVVALVGPVSTLVAGLIALGSGTPAEEPVAGSFIRGAVVAEGAWRWFKIGSTSLPVTWTIDGLAAAMLVAVGLVASCVVVFSAGYMAEEAGWARYFALLSLFAGAMNLVVIGSSFPALFIGWELVGACSYLLIGFWYRKPSAMAAAMKAFLTTRVGDVGLLLGIAVLWAATGSATYAGALGNLGGVSVAVATGAAVAIAIGAIGKSAQFPLHAWLPDAMEGPTPVSALIHAATMVAAGVYLVVRVWPLFEAAPLARLVLLTAGCISALGAALAALPQRDIKKVLAYSTVSQLGFMFCALGVGAWYAAFFHLLTHAAFKALLFLTSGSVIHGAGTQDMHEMGGLRRTMPFTFSAWIIGVFALAGAPGLAGFFSKDLLLESVWAESPAVAIVLFGASTLTAFYCARSTRLVFFGDGTEGAHPHESPLSMLAPLGALSAAAIAAGWLGPRVAHALAAESEPLAIAVSAAAVGLAVAGAIAGWMASAGAAGDRRTAQAMGRTWPVLAAAFSWDTLVDRTVVHPVVVGSRALWAIGDRLVADGIAEGSARLARRAGRGLSSLQEGDAQSYATVLTVGFVLMVVASIWLGR